MTDSPAPKRRGWIDALVATALRWNERLGRPVGEDSPPEPTQAARPAHPPRRRLHSALGAGPETGPHRG
jgi:hypothetical protein